MLSAQIKISAKFVIVFALVAFTKFVSINGADATDISRLRAFLLNNYDPKIRPVQNENNVTLVSVHFFNYGFEFVSTFKATRYILTSVNDSQDDKNGILTLHSLVGMVWKDASIQWNPLEYGNLSEIHFQPTELWRPDLAVYNGMEQEIDHFGTTLIFALHTNWVQWVPPAKFIVGCNTDYYRWPFDDQYCEIRIVSWDHSGDEIELKVFRNHTKLSEDLFYVDSPLQNREWDLVQSSVACETWNYTFEPPENEIIIIMHIRRRGSTHTAAIITMAIGIASAILISFWLNPYANERIPVILTSMLLSSFVLIYISSVIPNNGKIVPWLISYFRDSLIMVNVAFVWTIILRFVAKTKRNSQVPLPQWIDNMLDGHVGTFLCLNPRPTMTNRYTKEESNNSSQGQLQSGEDDSDELMCKEVFYKEDWGWFANILDRLAFLLYFIIYICFILAF